MTAAPVIAPRGKAVASPEVRSRMVLVTLGAVLLALMFAYVMLGPVIFGPDLVIKALFNRAEEVFHRISVWEVRLPRVLIAALAGSMLSSSGALLQSVLRNPLAARQQSG